MRSARERRVKINATFETLTDCVTAAMTTKVLRFQRKFPQSLLLLDEGTKATLRSFSKAYQSLRSQEAYYESFKFYFQP